jgi:hypothetical protein
MSVNEKMTAIADAIREKTGGTEALSLDGMANGINEVYDKGRNDEWSDFWDAFQDYGKRTNYYYAFYSESTRAWNDKNFKPKYDIKPTNMSRFMRYSGITNLEEILEKQGVVLDTSKATNMMLAFADMVYLEVLPSIDVSSATDSNGSANIFNYDGKLHTIRKLTVAENINMSNSFISCGSLKNIIIDGVLGRNANFSYSPLTVDSVKSIIIHLKNYAGTENAGKYTLTLSDVSKTAMSELGAIPEFNNKTYDAYITDIGWNLA